MSTTTAGRRKSGGGVGVNLAMAPAGPGAGSGTVKRPGGVGPSKTASGANCNRIDPGLMMSTNARKSAEDVRTAGGVGHGHGRHKSSDRLHRLGGGASATNLTHSKRSKSYSQVMNAGAAGAAGKKKKREDKDDEDEDGWTSASQKGTPEQSRSPRSGSDDDDDEGALVMAAKKKQAPAEALQATTPKDQQLKKSEHTKPNDALQRSDTQVTLRGFQTTPTQDSIPLPPQPDQQDDGPSQQSSNQALSHDGSDDTLAHVSTPPDSREPSVRPSLDRAMSSTSGRTLTAHESRDETSSPISVRSRTSIRSRTSLYPRESQGPAAPKLSTQYALAGALGSLQEDSEMEQAMNQPRRRFLSEVGMKNSASEPSHLKERSVDSVHMSSTKSARRKSSISSIQSTTINLPSASPSMADVSVGAVRIEHGQYGSGSSAMDAAQRASSSGFHPAGERTSYERRRTTSTQSLSATDAANLATRLRMARGESFDEAHTTSASRLLSSRGSKYFTLSNRNNAASTKAMKEYNKPTVSVFVKRLGERKNIEVKVEKGSLFDEDFSRARLTSRRGVGGAERQGDGVVDDGDDSDENDEVPPSVRYVMDFGLSGPAVHKTETTEALLSTLLDHDEFEATWAPALANAAGLGEGTRRAQEVAREGGGMDSMHLGGLNSTGGVAVNGPNATPMHFLHGLTNTTDAPFPLDPSDIVPTASNTHAALVNGGEYLDAKNLRSIAMTWTALNVSKNHVVTRRYVDPMRESLERVGRAGGLAGTKWLPSTPVSHGHGQYGGHLTPGSGSTTPGGSLRWASWRNLFSEHHTLREEA